MIRSALATDVKALKRLLGQLGYPDLDDDLVLQKIRLHQNGTYRLLVYETGERVVGFIALHWFELIHLRSSLGRISAFCVDEEFRSQGIGSALLEAAESMLAAMGCGKIEVTSNAKRLDTHAFYLGRGYKEDSKRFVKYS